MPVKAAKDERRVVDKARATALVFRLAREERDAWINWPARAAALMAAELSAAPSENGQDVTLKTGLMQNILEAHGRWDNTDVEIWRVNWADTSQRVMMRRGAIGQVRRGRLHFVAEMRSLAHVLGQTIGRTFQATCDTALGPGLGELADRSHCH